MLTVNKMLVVGIAGGTASGKTTIAKKIAELLGGNVARIEHDSYYRAHHELTYDERTQLNYDHPDSFETELLVQHLEALRRGESVEVPVYDYSIYDRTDQTITLAPPRALIVEGIMIFEHPELRKQFDLKVFVDCDADVRILRRALRDVQERGRSLESVVNQYLGTVKPMHEAYVEPSKRHADIIVSTLVDCTPAIDVLSRYLNDYTKKS